MRDGYYNQKVINIKFLSVDGPTSTNLEKSFSLEDIKCAVWVCGSEKAPGPDGFIFQLIKKY